MAGTTYDAYDADVNRRIELSETRIKYWVIAGVIANLLAAISLGIPLVYYLGSLNTQTATAITKLDKSVLDAEALHKRVNRLEVRQNAVVQHLRKSDDWEPPE